MNQNIVKRTIEDQYQYSITLNNTSLFRRKDLAKEISNISQVSIKKANEIINSFAHDGDGMFPRVYTIKHNASKEELEDIKIRLERVRVGYEVTEIKLVLKEPTEFYFSKNEDGDYIHKEIFCSYGEAINFAIKNEYICVANFLYEPSPGIWNVNENYYDIDTKKWRGWYNIDISLCL